MYTFHSHNIDINLPLRLYIHALVNNFFFILFPNFQPELVSRVEKDLLKIMAGGTADNLDILTSLFVSNSNLAKFSILKHKFDSTLNCSL